MQGNINNQFIQWEQGVYVGFDSWKLIVLRLRQGDYLSLSPDLFPILQTLFDTPFYLRKGNYIPLQPLQNMSQKALNATITNLLKEEIIEFSDESNRRIEITQPLEEGGLHEMEWYSHTQDASLPLLMIFSAWRSLQKVHRRIEKTGMKGLITFLKDHRPSFACDSAAETLSYQLAKAVEHAGLFLTKRSLCLPYAAALTLLHYQYRVSCDFVIGVQSRPFYAHAWVESAGCVLNDNPHLSTQLAPLFRLSCS